jgi:hypothetical protein
MAGTIAIKIAIFMAALLILLLFTAPVVSGLLR